MPRLFSWRRSWLGGLALAAILFGGLFAAACSSGGSSGGLTVLGPSRSPGATPASPNGTASPVASPQSSLSPLSPEASPGGPSPVVTATPTGGVTPTPSTSPVYLDPADEFEAYLAAVKPIRMGFHRLALQLNRIIWKQAHRYADATWPPAGRKVNRLSKKMDGMRADWDVVVPPSDMRKAHNAYLRCMRANQLAYQKIAFYLINKADWSEDSRNGRRVQVQWDRAARNFDVFKHKVMVQSRQLDVKVPWKW